MDHHVTALTRAWPCRDFPALRGLGRGAPEIGLAWASLADAVTGTWIEAGPGRNEPDQVDGAARAGHAVAAEHDAARDRLVPSLRRVSRRALRALLTSQTRGRVAPADWEFARRAGGGAEVVAPERGWEVSIAYSGGHCVVVATSERRLGVDLEAVVDPAPNDLPEHLLSPKEIRLVRAAPEAFWSVWTLKEAFAKEIGCGLVDEPALIDTAAFACREQGRLIRRRDGGAAMHCCVVLGGHSYALALSYGPPASQEINAPR